MPLAQEAIKMNIPLALALEETKESFDEIRYRLLDERAWLTNRLQMNDVAERRETHPCPWEEEPRLQRNLETVEQALQRLESGQYGNCVQCGKTINLERLHALPTTTVCVSCKHAS
jgi:RNA polymerase-binding protein DksA